MQVAVIHGVFAPCDYKNHRFVDGGILDNVPAAEVKKLGVDKVIAIKFPVSRNYKPKNIYEVAFKSIDILFETKTEEIAKESDFILDLDLTQASVFDIKKIDYCYEIGYRTAIEKMDEIKRMLEE